MALFITPARIDQLVRDIQVQHSKITKSLKEKISAYLKLGYYSQYNPGS